MIQEGRDKTFLMTFFKLYDTRVKHNTLNQTFMRTHIRKGGLLILVPFLFLSAMACSSSDTENPLDSDLIENPDPDPDSNPDPNPDPDPSDTQKDIPQVDDKVTQFMERYQVPGAALAVSVNERMVYSKGYGLANVGNSTAVKADDRFRIASITKVFTATAILRLVEEGLLSLDDRVV